MTDTVIDNPTYTEQVRHFFEDVDCQHMFSRGVDLTTYPQLNAQASHVVVFTRAPNAAMPPEADRTRSQARHKTLVNSMMNASPRPVRWL